MMETILASPQKEVRIGVDHPFVIIGERINPTGRKLLAAELAVGNYDRVVTDALAQVEAGAHMLDVNAGIPMIDEPTVLAEIVRLVQSVVNVPLSIDSSVVAALEAGLAAYQGKALVNSVTGEDARLEAVLPLVKKYGAAVIGITNDESGISHDPEVRLAVARKIIERAADYGIPKADIVIDPLAMPVGAVPGSGAIFLGITRRIVEELQVTTTCGASNISFGLPGRDTLSAAFLTMGIGGGVTSAIMNPLKPETANAVRAANLLMGHDDNAQAWISANRPPEAESGTERAVRSRRPRRE
ncbi:MAG: dihydropteroate synthase [Anaerolineaceae bacterium]|nr:dihydropteroate synthase [Anaerolineaceae bacterium]